MKETCVTFLVEKGGYYSKLRRAILKRDEIDISEATNSYKNSVELRKVKPFKIETADFSNRTSFGVAALETS